MLQLHAEYFEEHPRARAFAWKRIGLMAATYGDHAEARGAFLRSLAGNVDPKTFGHLLRSVRRSTHRLSGSDTSP